VPSFPILAGKENNLPYQLACLILKPSFTRGKVMRSGKTIVIPGGDEFDDLAEYFGYLFQKDLKVTRKAAPAAKRASGVQQARPGGPVVGGKAQPGRPPGRPGPAGGGKAQPGMAKASAVAGTQPRTSAPPGKAAGSSSPARDVQGADKSEDLVRVRFTFHLPVGGPQVVRHPQGIPTIRMPAGLEGFKEGCESLLEARSGKATVRGSRWIEGALVYKGDLGIPLQCTLDVKWEAAHSVNARIFREELKGKNDVVKFIAAGSFVVLQGNYPDTQLLDRLLRCAYPTDLSEGTVKRTTRLGIPVLKIEVGKDSRDAVVAALRDAGATGMIL